MRELRVKQFQSNRQASTRLHIGTVLLWELSSIDDRSQSKAVPIELHTSTASYSNPINTHIYIGAASLWELSSFDERSQSEAAPIELHTDITANHNPINVRIYIEATLLLFLSSIDERFQSKAAPKRKWEEKKEKEKKEKKERERGKEKKKKGHIKYDMLFLVPRRRSRRSTIFLVSSFHVVSFFKSLDRPRNTIYM